MTVDGKNFKTVAYGINYHNAGQKLLAKHLGIVKKLVSLSIRGKLREERPEIIFQEFLARCIVDTSAKMGILGDPKKLSVAMDGSCYNSDAFKSVFKRRTSVERSNKRILVDYNIESGRCRSSKQRFARATFAEVNIHLDAWIKHTAFSIVTLLNPKVVIA